MLAECLALSHTNHEHEKIAFILDLGPWLVGACASAQARSTSFQLLLQRLGDSNVDIQVQAGVVETWERVSQLLWFQQGWVGALCSRKSRVVSNLSAIPGDYPVDLHIFLGQLTSNKSVSIYSEP